MTHLFPDRSLVTLTGGKLSHGAVVAREYRIPAVLGVKDVFDRLTDGQLVEVDGTAGTIRLLERGHFIID